MNALSHLVFSLALALGLAGLFHMPLSAPFVAAAVLGALLPDVDHAETKIFKFVAVAIGGLVFGFVLTARGGGAVFLAAVFGLAAVGAVFLLKPKHRGLTHAPLAAVVFGLLVGFVAQNVFVGIGGAVAYAGHLLADGTLFRK